LIWVALATDSPLTFWATTWSACCAGVTVPNGNMAAQHRILDVEASSLQGGMSFNDWVSVTLVL